MAQSKFKVMDPSASNLPVTIYNTLVVLYYSRRKSLIISPINQHSGNGDNGTLLIYIEVESGPKLLSCSVLNQQTEKCKGAEKYFTM